MNGSFFVHVFSVTAVSLGTLFSCSSPTLQERYQQGVQACEEQKPAAGFAIFSELAEEQYAPAMERVGVMLISGTGHEKDVGRGVDWIKRCSNGVLAAETCVLMGQSYYEGGSIDENVALGMVWMKRAAERGNEDAKRRFAAMVLDNPDKIPPHVRTLQTLRETADDGYTDAQNRLASVYERVEDFGKDQSIEYYLMAAREGKEEAGAGLVKLMLPEEPWLQQLRAQKHGDARRYVDELTSVRDAYCSMLLAKERLAEDDPERIDQGLTLLRYAATHDDPQAQYMLGHLYEQGLHVPQDSQEAEQWYTRSAKQGNHKAQGRLALAIARAGRTDVPEGKSDYWLEKALKSYDWEAFEVADQIFALENERKNPDESLVFNEPVELRLNNGKIYKAAGKTDVKTQRFVFAGEVDGTNALPLRKLDFNTRMKVDPTYRRAYAEVQALEKTVRRAADIDQLAPLFSLHDSCVKDMDELDARLVTELGASGDDDALFTQGMMYYFGVHRARSEKRARNSWKEASKSGHSLAGYALACSYIEDDPAKAIKYLRTAADQGCLRASYLMGIIYQEGLYGQKRNMLLAERYLEAPATQGYSRDAVARLAHIFYEGGDTEGRLDTCRDYAKDPTTDPDGTLSYILARYYKSKKSRGAARRWLERSADAPIPNPAANCDMGILAERTDPAKAYLLYRKAAALGDPRGQYRLGRLHLRRNSPVANEKLGVRCLNISAAQGNRDAQKYLAKYLKKKRGVKKYLEELATMQEEERNRHARRLENLRSHYTYHLLYSKDDDGRMKSGSITM